MIAGCNVSTVTELGRGDKYLLPEILAPGLDVIFVGAAPSLAAALSGHYYAGPRNRFWDLLFQAGFTPQRLEPHEDRTVLNHGIGLTAVFLDRVSTANSLLPAPSEEQRTRLLERLRALHPLVVCYNGKDVFRMCLPDFEPAWGLLDDPLGTAVQFVVPSSSGRADRWGAERLHLYRELRSMLDGLRGLQSMKHAGLP